ncbi:hypothetical protein CCP2SC5_1490005 [Azospirillaceae bacterium]
MALIMTINIGSNTTTFLSLDEPLNLDDPLNLDGLLNLDDLMFSE